MGLKHRGGGGWLGDHEADIGDEEAASALQLAKINHIFPEHSQLLRVVAVDACFLPVIALANVSH